jgi:superfamily II DNA or RNA helicase
MVKLVETPTRLLLTGEAPELKLMAEELRFHPDSYWRADAYQIFKMTNGEKGWDGYTYPLHVIKQTQGTQAEALRGHMGPIQEAADVHDITITATRLPRPFAGLVPDDLPDDLLVAPFELDEAQRAGIAAWLSNTLGINRIPVSGGKTAMFMAAAVFIKRAYPTARFLYFTPSERLVSQVIKEARQFIPAWNISQFGGRVKDQTGQDMVVATAGMLGANFDRLKQEGWFKTFMGVLVDESHHAASPTIEKVLRNTPALFRLGASDSLKEDDKVKHTKIRGLVGPLLGYEEVHGLVDSGRLARPNIYVVDIPAWAGRFADVTHVAEEGTKAWSLIENVWHAATYMGPAWDEDPNASDGIRRDKKGEPVPRPNWHRLVLEDTREVELESRWCLLDRLYDRAIIRFQERNELASSWAAHWAGLGHHTLVVCTRTLHVLILHALMQKLVPPGQVRYLFSEHNTEERDETFEWLKTTPGSILVTPLIKEGVSIPEISAGVIADYVSSWEVASQLIGRFVRKKVVGQNEAHVTMFLDRQHPTYKRGSMAVFKELQQIKGFSFYHPCDKPGSATPDKLFHGR